MMLFSNAEPGFGLPLRWIIPATIVTAAFFIFVVGKGIRAQYRPVRAGKETMVGKTVEALSKIDAQGGKVFVEGEYWNAVSDDEIKQAEPVEIVAVDGLTLKVKPKN
jgi:membrane-bound serine protease (ClpP class)